ncbi:MAG TPA: hypothetical protein VHW26_00880 [Solirubrobacteraceae bacterium]|nr:hypothetical protein [Solirubrobacteraceae bacterium]
MTEDEKGPAGGPGELSVVHHSVVRLLGPVAGSLTAVVTLIAAVLGVLFLLVPSLQPLSRSKIDASISVPTVEPDVSELRWAEHQYPRGGRAGAIEVLGKLLGHPYNQHTDGTVEGMVVYVRLATDGFQHRSISLRAEVYDAHTGEPPRSVDISQIYPRSGTLTVDAPSRSSVQLMLLDDVKHLSGVFFVRVEAYDDGGVLAYADSPLIHGDG